jgi:hypothetical protein
MLKQLVNWNFAVELSNSIQRKRERRKVVSDVYKAKLRIHLWFQLGKKRSRKALSNGRNKTHKSNDIEEMVFKRGLRSTPNPPSLPRWKIDKERSFKVYRVDGKPNPSPAETNSHGFAKEK